KACGDAITAATCAQFLSSTPLPACAANPGAIANGAACAFASQCQSTHCAIPNGSLCGTCAPLPKVGDPCGATGGCGPTLPCGKASNICSALGGKGAVCDKDVVCDTGLGCVQTKGTTMGTCVALAEEAETCDSKSQTAPQCDRAAGLWCTPMGKCSKITSFV